MYAIHDVRIGQVIHGIGKLTIDISRAGVVDTGFSIAVATEPSFISIVFLTLVAGFNIFAQIGASEYKSA